MNRFSLKEFPDEVLELRGTKIFSNSKELDQSDDSAHYYLFKNRKLWVKTAGYSKFIYMDGKPFRIGKEGVLEECSEDNVWFSFLKLAMWSAISAIIVRILFR